jgi:hypothetical protein
MCVGFMLIRVTELWMPPRCPVISDPTVFTSFSCAWYMIAEPGMIRCETIARAVSAPLTLNASIQSLSSMPAAFASSSLIQTLARRG